MNFYETIHQYGVYVHADKEIDAAFMSRIFRLYRLAENKEKLYSWLVSNTRYPKTSWQKADKVRHIRLRDKWDKRRAVFESILEGNIRRQPACTLWVTHYCLENDNTFYYAVYKDGYYIAAGFTDKWQAIKKSWELASKQENAA